MPPVVATRQFLASRRLRVPSEVSLFCPDQDAASDWCQPAVSHIHWDSRPLVRRVVRWVTNVSQGQEDFRQIFAPAEFVRGGTLGPAKDG